MPDDPAVSASSDPNDHEAHEATLRALYTRERRERERLEAELRHYRDSLRVLLGLTPTEHP